MTLLHSQHENTKDTKHKGSKELWQEAQLAFDQDNYGRALELFQRIKDKSSRVRYNLGLLYAKLDAPDQSLESMKAAIETDRYLTCAYLAIANMVLSEGIDGNPRTALGYYKEALKSMRGNEKISYLQLGLDLTIESFKIRHDLGLVYFKLGDYHTALSHLLDAYMEAGEEERGRIRQTICILGRAPEAAAYGIDLSKLWRIENSQQRVGSALELVIPVIKRCGRQISNGSRMSTFSHRENNEIDKVFSHSRVVVWPESETIMQPSIEMSTQQCQQIFHGQLICYNSMDEFNQHKLDRTSSADGKCFNFSSELSYEQVYTVLYNVSESQPAKIRLYYKDEESDWIVFGCEEDWNVYKCIHVDPDGTNVKSISEFACYSYFESTS